MLRSRSLCAFVAFSAMCAMCALTDVTFAQPGGGKGAKQKAAQPPVPAPLVSALLPYVGDETVQKELKLSEEQTKKLVAFRQKLWDETYTTAPQNLKTAERNKAIAAEFAAVLDAGQLQRAKQLAAQRTLIGVRFGVSSNTLALYPEVAAALKLDETQKKLVETGNFVSVYLTHEQGTTLKGLLGEAPKTPLKAEFDPRTGGGGGGGGFRTVTRVPPRLNYLLAVDVQKELKLTDDQIKAVTELRAKFPATSGFPGGFGQPAQTVSPAEQKKVADEEKKKTDALVADTSAALAKLLSADQKERLAQIERQTRGGTEFVEGSELGTALGVTDAQRKAHAAASEARAAAVVKAVATGDPLEKVTAAVEAANRTFTEVAEKILTADQQAKKKELLGPAFTGNVRPAGTGGFPGGSPLTIGMRTHTFGKYSSELATLNQFKGVRDELKLTDEQVKKLADANTALLEKFPFQEMITAVQDLEKGKKFFEERSAFIEKAVTETLTKEQQVRFRELLVQQAEAPRTGPTGPGGLGGGFLPTTLTTVTAAGLPGVAEAIKLTADQKAKLLDGTPAAQVLTDDQKTAIKGLMGKPVNVAVVFRTPASVLQGLTFGKYAAELTPLSRYPGVRDELKLTDEQIKKLTDANTVLLEKFPARDVAVALTQDAEKGKKLVGERSAFVEKTIGEVLTKEQQVRFRELLVQQAEAPRTGPGGAPAGFALATSAARIPGVAEAIKLTADQKAKLLDGTPSAEVLTEDQKTAIKGLMGKAVDVRVVFALRGGGFPDGGGFDPRDPLPTLPRFVTVVRTGSHWDAVKITPEQVTKLAAALNEYGLATARATVDEQAAAAATVARAVGATLTAEQRTRLEQIDLQERAANSLVTALLGTTRSPAALKKELAITDDQEKAIRAASAELVQLANLVDNYGYRTDEVGKSASEVLMKLRDRLDAKIVDVLTADQKAKWKALTGEPLSGITKQPLLGGFRGGFGPGGGFDP